MKTLPKTWKKIPACFNVRLEIIESVEVSCGEVKVTFEGSGHRFTWVNLVFAIFFALAFVDLVFTELDLINIRSTFDN